MFYHRFILPGTLEQDNKFLHKTFQKPKTLLFGRLTDVLLVN